MRFFFGMVSLAISLYLFGYTMYSGFVGDWGFTTACMGYGAAGGWGWMAHGWIEDM